MEEIKESLELYVKHKIKPGGFLTACLENNLSEAFGRADHINQARMFGIVQYMYNEIPSDCWGSPEKVEAWVTEERQANGL